MPIINFTPADALQTTVVEEGIYPCVISRIEGPNKSSSGKSFSYVVDIQITDGKYKGKERTIMFNTETKSASILGDMQFYPDAYFLVVDAAIRNAKVEAVNKSLDTDDLLDKPFDCQWGIHLAEGRPINVILNFYPSGYAASAPAF